MPRGEEPIPDGTQFCICGGRDHRCPVHGKGERVGGSRARREATRREDFDEWITAATIADYGNAHAAAIDFCFAPPEAYDDPGLALIFDLYEFVMDQPCECTPAMVEDRQPCPRCTLLNVNGAGR